MFASNLERFKANAMSDNLALDLNITNDDVNTSISVYHFVFTLFTLPSNAVSKAVGAHLWIPILMSSWAAVTWAHALIYVSFYYVCFIQVDLPQINTGFQGVSYCSSFDCHYGGRIYTRLSWLHVFMVQDE